MKASVVQQIKARMEAWGFYGYSIHMYEEWCGEISNPIDISAVPEDAEGEWAFMAQSGPVAATRLAAILSNAAVTGHQMRDNLFVALLGYKPSTDQIGPPSVSAAYRALDGAIKDSLILKK